MSKKRIKTRDRYFFVDINNGPGVYICASSIKDAISQIENNSGKKPRVTEVKKIAQGYMWYGKYIQKQLM